jgi:MATE family multidrug resistance protein
MNGLNIALDLWFVLGLGWGVPGVAVATLIAEWTGLALGLWFCRAAFGPVWQAARARLRDTAALRRMAGVNTDIMIRSVLLQLSFTSFLFLGAGLGDVTLAANQVLLQFIEVAAYALDGFAFAAEALVGQAVGARSVAKLRRAAALAAMWSLGSTILMSLAILTAGPAIIDLLTTEPQVRAEARTYLPWLVAAPLIGIAAWVLDGIFIGATRTREMRNAMLISVAVYGVALSLLLPAFGNHGLWAGLMVLNATRGVTLGLRWPSVLRAAE